jgi:Fic family protein
MGYSVTMSYTDKEAKQFAAIIEALEAYPNGALTKELLDSLEPAIEPRTLQRRLSKLMERGEVEKAGKGRATRYLLSQAQKKEQFNNDAPLSVQAQKTKQLLAKPFAKRKKTTYNAAFLENYVPNKTKYLSENEREKLFEIGESTPFNHKSGTYSKDILSRLMVDLSWNSSRLEGNTYSLLDTQRLIDLGKAAEDKPLLDAQMVLNHKDAIEFITEPSEEVGFNRYTILNLHALLSNNLLADPRAEGRLRTIPVGIGDSAYEPLGVPQKIAEYFELLLKKVSKISNPYEQSFFILAQLPYLQAFDDVNKRVSRLAANIPLIKNQLSPLSFVDVSDKTYIDGLLGVYEFNDISILKDLYIWAYERSAHRYAALQKTLMEPDPFRLKYREAIKEAVSFIVLNTINSDNTSRELKAFSEKVPQGDRAKFIEAVDMELLDLHEGNISRYRIKPSDFEKWKKGWDK